TSGLPEIATSVAAMATFEGENWVMWQQVFRYLLKGVAAVRNGQTASKGMAYVAEYHHLKQQGREKQRCSADGDDFLNPEILLEVYRHRAARLVCTAVDLLTSDAATPPTSAWNTHMMALISAARAHIELFVVSTFCATINADPMIDHTLRPVLSQLIVLFA